MQRLANRDQSLARHTATAGLWYGISGMNHLSQATVVTANRLFRARIARTMRPKVAPLAAT
jgi:hypothetical protein